MAYGRTNVGGPSAAVAPGFASTAPAAPRPSSGTSSLAPAILVVVFGVLYLIWAVVERHEKVQTVVQPHAVALNARNLIAILLPVVFGVPLLKIAAAKYKAWGLPGGDTIVAYMGSV